METLLLHYLLLFKQVVQAKNKATKLHHSIPCFLYFMAAMQPRFQFIAASQPPQSRDGAHGVPGYAVAVLADAEEERCYPLIAAPTSPRYKMRTFIHRADAIAFMKAHPSAEFRGRRPVLNPETGTFPCESNPVDPC